MNKKCVRIVGVVLSLAGVAGSGCSTAVSDHGGSETNWLATCATDDDCGVRACVCGRCTTACDEASAASACSGALDRCATKGTAAFGALCGANTQVTGACLKSCADGAACPSGTECVGTACVPKRASATVSADGGVTSPSHVTTYSTFTDTISVLDVEPTALLGRCLPRALPVDSSGRATCSIVEAQTACDCNAEGHAPLDAAAVDAARAVLRYDGACDTDGMPPCTDYCACELKAFSGAKLDECLTKPDTVLSTPGWCYVDPAAGFGADALVTDNCSKVEQRLLRLSMPPTPADGRRTAMIRCSSEIQQTAGSAGSSPGAIGDPCMPGDEYRPEFPGFSYSEVNIETGSPSCQSGVCLVANFNGRVTCPYGQNASPNPKGKTCTTPDGKTVVVPVPGQLTGRPPETAVYCSARCAGPGPGPFVACPDGFTCAPLVQDYGFGNSDVAGSYCVRSDSVVTDPSQMPQQNCQDIPAANVGQPPPLGCGDP